MSPAISAVDLQIFLDVIRGKSLKTVCSEGRVGVTRARKTVFRVAHRLLNQLDEQTHGSIVLRPAGYPYESISHFSLDRDFWIDIVKQRSAAQGWKSEK